MIRRQHTAHTLSSASALAVLVALGALAVASCGAPAAVREEPPRGASAEPAAGGASLPARGSGERASPNGHVSGTLGGAAVEVAFGRRSVRGRRVFGELVPWNEVWRTGADEATAIAFGQDVLVEGQPLAAGVYGLFTIPTERTWTVIFSRQAEQWGAYRYDASSDALRVEVTPVPHAPTEQLDIALEDGALRIRWADLEVPVRITSP